MLGDQAVDEFVQALNPEEIDNILADARQCVRNSRAAVAQYYAARRLPSLSPFYAGLCGLDVMATASGWFFAKNHMSASFFWSEVAYLIISSAILLLILYSILRDFAFWRKQEGHLLAFDLLSQTSRVEIDFLKEVRRRYTIHDIRFVIERLRFYQADFANWQSGASAALLRSSPLLPLFIPWPSNVLNITSHGWPTLYAVVAIFLFSLYIAKETHDRRQADERVITILQLALPETKATDSAGEE